MSVDYELIGRRIREHRKAQGKTQEMLAEFLSVSVGYVSQIERGVTKISLDTLSRICTFLSCELSCLLSGSNPGQDTYLNFELEHSFNMLDNRQKKIILDMIQVIQKY